MQPNDVLLLTLSILIWLTLLWVIQSPAAMMLAFVTVIAGALWLRIQLLPSGEGIRTLLWGSSAITSLARIATTRSQREKNIAGIALLTSLSLLAFIKAEAALGGLLSFFLGIGTSLLLAAASRPLQRWLWRTGKRWRAHLNWVLLTRAYRRLEAQSEETREALAKEIVASLEASRTKCMTLAALAHEHARSWRELWVITALLAESGEVRLTGKNISSKNTVALLNLDEAGRKEARPPTTAEVDTSGIHLPSITIIGDFIFSNGGDVMAGDKYHVSGANVTGAFGRNKVRDISSTTSGGQAQTITRNEIVTEARKVAASLDTDRAAELREVADAVEEAKHTSDLRSAVQRIIGIASMAGEHGSHLFELAKQFLEGISS
ncbi:hypothetical protein GCM10023321_26370 [Pseudonocardia eucalypti]|uniref:Uncharacterized protein n=1 Tax=Pseudonocardia eucalypti TaxID=648755 RepID=A0ABP9PZK7_9PSEU|nr:hypothetical protein [Pseudonocardia eucalypti]